MQDEIEIDKEYFSQFEEELTDKQKYELKETFNYHLFRLDKAIDELKDTLKTTWLFKILYKILNKIY